MSSPTFPALQTIVFADLDSDLWGLAWASPSGVLGLAQWRAGSPTTAGQVSFDGDAASGSWQLAGETAALTVSPLSEPVASSALGGFDQLSEVHGRLLTGPQQPVRAIGIRAVRAGIDPSSLDSLRDARVWFAPDDGLALTALRPSGARGHERDRVTASVFEPSAATAVADPRLSTTYATDGAPARVGLELWVQDDEGAEYPRRVAGETTGAQIALSAEGFSLNAHAMRWHSRGRDGIGAYVLAQPR